MARDDRIEYDEYFVSSCKDIIDAIDRQLAIYFEFTPEEVDAVLAFDQQFCVIGGCEA